METLAHHLVGWIDASPGWAYGIVFLIAFGESLAVAGILVPGAVIMVGAGTLIATGALSFLPTAAIAAAGAIAGDGLSFWLGHRYRDRLRHPSSA